jgi:ABC-2 type transport system permease protein
MWAVGVLANYKATSQVWFDGMFALQAAHNLARVPTPLYGPVLQVLLTFVVPVAFLCTVPAQVLFGDVDLRWGAAAVLITAFVLWGTSKLWNRELRNYAGAMG